jgi:hypothetical protein
LDSDVFLWGQAPQPGVFSKISPRERSMLAAEQNRFVIAVFRDRPLDLIGSSLGSAGRQLGMLNLSEFNYPSREANMIVPQLVPREQIDYRASKAFARTMPTGITEILTKAAVVAAMGWILFYLTVLRSGDEQRQSRVAFLILIVGALMINAAVCGALSTPHDRYQARVIWLLPLLALCLPSRRTWVRRTTPSIAGEGA